MTFPRAENRIFSTSSELQDFLLTLPAGVHILVPHMRLAHQVWRRQRLAARTAGLSAWEPLSMSTLSAWWRQLWGQLWQEQRPATALVRLGLWLRAMEAVPPLAGVEPDLSWAAALDETYDLSLRYRLPVPELEAGESPLIAWRLAVTRDFAARLAEQGLMMPAAMSEVLLGALNRKALPLPERLVVVGLETPAPVEEDWLGAVARHTQILQVSLVGREEGISPQAVVFPDGRQEQEWVAARILELSQEQQIPLHRLAITAPNLEDYLPDLRRIWREILGPAATAAGGHYNFSLGPTLAETPLFQAALLPLAFLVGGEQRQDLVAWGLSPFYGAWHQRQPIFLNWDRVWRKQGLDYGWRALGEVASLAVKGEGESGAELLGQVEQALALLTAAPLPAADWQRRLQEIWRGLGFPATSTTAEARQWQALLDLLAEVAQAAGDRILPPAAWLEWLTWGAGRADLPGEGSSEAGIQIQGLLELRGLDFEAVFCLGLNMGVFPPAPRYLPLLTPQEKSLVLGGDYQSQWKFAETSYRYLLAAAPRLILTRPLEYQEEERLASPIVDPDLWERPTTKFCPLSQPHPAWLRTPAVRAALLPPPPAPATAGLEFIPAALPEVISLSALEAALTCPCRFYLSVLLKLEELPEVESGLAPLVRGEVMHRVLYEFTCRFAKELEAAGAWDDNAARRHLEEAVATFAPVVGADPLWEAEKARWLAGSEGVLCQWLEQEKQRYQEGWRWLGMEEEFSGLQLPGWPTLLRGRLDRIDGHETEGLMLWDYKTGAIPKKREMEEERSRFQLLGYLRAVNQGLTALPPRPEVRAGIIGLKSSRQEHLRFEDYQLSAADWQEILTVKLAEVAKIGEKVGRGDFSPDPSLPPPRRNNSCQYCPFALICGHRPPETEEDET